MIAIKYKMNSIKEWQSITMVYHKIKKNIFADLLNAKLPQIPLAACSRGEAYLFMVGSLE